MIKLNQNCSYDFIITEAVEFDKWLTVELNVFGEYRDMYIEENNLSSSYCGLRTTMSTFTALVELIKNIGTDLDQNILVMVLLS